MNAGRFDVFIDYIRLCLTLHTNEGSYLAHT
jgi:hypothetical protein